jgi:hypothetical protein
MDWPTIILATVGGTGGGVAVVVVLSKWLGKVWADRLLETLQQENRIEIEKIKTASNAEIVRLQNTLDRANKLLDASVQKATIVTRTQFETEFGAYKEIFAALSDLSHCIAWTRQTIRITKSNETREEKIEELTTNYEALLQAHNKAIILKQNLSPFYATEIYEALALCLNESGGEINDLRLSVNSPEQFTSGWYEQGADRQEAFRRGYNQVSKFIRERIASLGILPS